MKFEYEQMPALRPISIPTKGRGMWYGLWIWLTKVRHWEVAEDWHFKIDGVEYVIEKGFQFDGASIPRYFWNWLSPTGILLVPGLVHDWAYKYASLKTCDCEADDHVCDQKEADELFRDIAVEVNGFKYINNIAYYALRLGGFIAWNGHRKND